MMKLFIVFIFMVVTLPYAVTTELLSSEDGVVKVKFSSPAWKVSKRSVGGVEHGLVMVKDAYYSEPAGVPDIPRIVANVEVPASGRIELSVLDYKKKKIGKFPILPSKGIIPRNIDPSTVPFRFGNVYGNSAIYPKSQADISEPFILKGLRGVTINFYPVQYNSADSSVYIVEEADVIVKVLSSESGKNELAKKRDINGYTREERETFQKFFLNSSVPERETSLPECGSMLIISYGDFIDAVKPFAEWKNKSGIRTEIVDVADIGNAQAIKSYVADYYDSTDLKYLLLVGDVGQVPTLTSSSNTESGASDNKYGCIEGSDSYVEVIVGRLSAENSSEVTAQVQKLIHYETALDSSDSWLISAYASAAKEEQDDVNMATTAVNKLKAHNYETVNFFKGAYSDDSKTSSWINDGLGIHINSSHGNETSIVGLNTSTPSKLNNEGMYSLNYTLACLPGTFNGYQPCLAETLLRKKSGGFAGAFMATISQPWDPPYVALNEIVDLITDNNPSDTKRTYGGIAMAGCYKMIAAGGGGDWVADCWELFGDPSLTIYTDIPKKMEISYPAQIPLGKQSVNITGTEGAVVCLYNSNENIQSVGTITGGSVTLDIDVKTTDTILVTATKFNTETYMGEISVVNCPYIALVKPVGGSVFKFGEDVSIEWEVGGGANSTTFDISYSLDNGGTWSSIENGFTGNKISWTIPDVVGSDSVLVKVKDVYENLSAESGLFSIFREPNMSVTPSIITLTLNKNIQKNCAVKLKNSGKGILKYEAFLKNGGLSVMINEIYVSHSAMFDGIEIYNPLPVPTNITGWKCKWNDDDNTSGSFTMPEKTIIPAKGTIVLSDVAGDSAKMNTFYVGMNLAWSNTQGGSGTGTELSISLLDEGGNEIDFVKSSGNSDTPILPENWSGAGIDLSGEVAYRNSNEDNNNKADWSGCTVADATVGTANTGQAYSSQYWVTLVNESGEVDFNQNTDIIAVLNTDSMSEGIYADTIVISHNDSSKSIVNIPVSLTVDYTQDISSEDLSSVLVNPNRFAVANNPVDHSEDAKFVFASKKKCDAFIKVYDNVGNNIFSWQSDSYVSAGKRKIVVWNRKNGFDRVVASGSYVAILKLENSDGSAELFKMNVLVK